MIDPTSPPSVSQNQDMIALGRATDQSAAFRALLAGKTRGLGDDGRDVPEASRNSAADGHNPRGRGDSVDPWIVPDASSMAVAELGQHGPVKATVAEAEKEATSPSESPAKTAASSGPGPRFNEAESR